MEWLKNRINILKIVVIIIMVILVSRLFVLQVIEGESYLTQSRNIVFKELPITASRGDIVDTYGRKIAYSRPGYLVQFDSEVIQNNTSNDSKANNNLINSTLIKLIKILSNNNEKFEDNFPISSYPYEFDPNSQFTVNDFYKFYEKKFNACKKSSLKYNKDFTKITIKFTFKDKPSSTEVLTPEKIMNYFEKQFGIKDDTDEITKHNLINYRFQLQRQSSGSRGYEPITLAKDVSQQTLSTIEENHRSLRGVSIGTAPIREYDKFSAVDSPIVGYVRKINAEQYNANKKNYKMDDIMGQVGIERYSEKYLKGKDGIRYIEADSWGRKKKDTGVKAPEKGDDVVLTIDNNLQKVGENSLKWNINRVRSSSHGGNADAASGAVVALDVHTGEVLCLVSYPYVNSNVFTQPISSKKWSELENDKQQPMLNKAISDAYPPGSTFKILTGIAALNEKKLGMDEQIYDQGVYPHTNLKCLEYALGEGSHGEEDIIKAISVSCNYFFYELGNRLGINKIDQYAKEFGLGEKTGIELDNEVSGLVASPAWRAKLSPNDKQWYFGYTLQTAIGQSDTRLTPLQVASYLTQVLDNGVRYKVHIVKKIISSTGNVVVDNKPEVVSKLNISPQIFAKVKEGMRKVTQDQGTAAAIFNNYPISVGGKTGSATVGYSNQSDAWFMGFAPYDNPQIAVVAFIKLGGYGTGAAPIAKDIFDAYFGLANKNTKTEPIDYSQGLKY